MTSPTPGDGKTVTTLNLAGALAQGSSAKVLLIDADLRRPTVSEYLPLGARARGLVDIIMNPAVTLPDVVQRFDALNLSVLPAGWAEAGTYELLTSPRFEAVLTEARAQYDYVLVDTPPLVPVPDSRLIGRWVDGFLVIVAAHKTPRRLLAEGLNLLDPEKAIGVVFNFDNRPLSGYRGLLRLRRIRPDQQRARRVVAPPPRRSDPDRDPCTCAALSATSVVTTRSSFCFRR